MDLDILGMITEQYCNNMRGEGRGRGGNNLQWDGDCRGVSLVGLKRGEKVEVGGFSNPLFIRSSNSREFFPFRFISKHFL